MSSALGGQGVCAPLTIAGAVTSAVFALDGEPVRVPGLRPGHRVLLDHGKVPYALKALAAPGASVWPLPAYSPACNPLAEGIAKSKASLRACKARTKRTLSTALAQARALVTAADIRGWFAHCGYVFSLK